MQSEFNIIVKSVLISVMLKMQEEKKPVRKYSQRTRVLWLMKLLDFFFWTSISVQFFSFSAVNMHYFVMWKKKKVKYWENHDMLGGHESGAEFSCLNSFQKQGVVSRQPAWEIVFISIVAGERGRGSKNPRLVHSPKQAPAEEKRAGTQLDWVTVPLAASKGLRVIFGVWVMTISVGGYSRRETPGSSRLRRRGGESTQCLPQEPGLWISLRIACCLRVKKIASSSYEPFTIIIDNSAVPKGFQSGGNTGKMQSGWSYPLVGGGDGLN